MFLNEFDMDPQHIYLNSGSHSICPRVVSEAVTRYQLEYERNPTDGLHKAWPRIWEIQKELGAFFHAQPQDLFLRSNVTEALNEFILGMPLEKGREILTTNLEYGAILNICSLRAQREDLKMRFITLPFLKDDYKNLGEQELADLIISQIRPETQMLVLSHVMTGTGLVMPIARIAQYTRKTGVLLVVDGAHAPGALPLDFRNLSEVDFYAGNLHKWMMGPKGTAFGWVSTLHQGVLRPLLGGWTTFETGEYFSGFGDQTRFQGRLLMPGCRDFAPFFALHEMFAFWRKYSPQAIFDRIEKLQTALEREIHRELQWESFSPPPGSLRGPLLTYELPKSLRSYGTSLMFQIYEKHLIQVAVITIQDRICMRFSPHIYNHEEELRKAVQILKTVS